MRVLIFRLLMGLVTGLIVVALPLVVLGDCVSRLLRGWADWAEVQYLLAVVARKIKARR